MSLVAGIGGLVGGLSGMFGGGKASDVQLPQQQSVNIGGITGNLNNAIPGLDQYNLGGQNLGQYQGALQGTINNPYQQFGQGAANQFAPQGMQNAQQGINNAGVMGNTVPGLTGAAYQILNQGFDPQHALYQQTLDQTSQQQLAGLGQSGLAQTPWGQGVAGQNLNNFNIGWQNNLLNRMVTGAQGAEGLMNQAGSNATNSFQLGNNASNAGAAAGMLPYATYNQFGQNEMNLLNQGAQYGQTASQIPQTGIGDWLQYLSGANQANSTANQQGQLALNQQNQQFNQNQQYGKAIGSGLSGIGNALNYF